jgi:hypothetical protein
MTPYVPSTVPRGEDDDDFHNKQGLDVTAFKNTSSYLRYWSSFSLWYSGSYIDAKSESDGADSMHWREMWRHGPALEDPYMGDTEPTTLSTSFAKWSG